MSQSPPANPAQLFDLSGQVALVTGASKGLGWAVAQTLAAAGARVVLTGRRVELLEERLEQLIGWGLSAEIAAFDAGDGDAAVEALNDIAARHGRLDILYSNTAAGVRKPFVELDEAEWQSVIDGSLTAGWRLARHAAPLMVKAGYGRIVFVSSINATVARPGISAYVTAKTALHGLVRGLAVELAPNGITVNALAPGYFHHRWQCAVAWGGAGVPEEDRRPYADRPLGRSAGTGRSCPLSRLTRLGLHHGQRHYRRRRAYRRDLNSPRKSTMSETKMHLVPWDRLQANTISVFRAAGSELREAQLIAEHLVEANLRGHDSHGVGVVPMYINGVRSGGMVMNQSLKVAVDTGAMLICDAGQGAGQVMAHDAMALGIARAKDEGSAIVSLRNSHHIGRIGHWAEQCAAAGVVSIHFVNVVAGAIVAPFGGTQSRLGTNPFAAAFPRDGAPPVVVDFATSKLAAGKVRVAHNKGVELPPGACSTTRASRRSTRRAVRNPAGLADHLR